MPESTASRCRDPSSRATLRLALLATTVFWVACVPIASAAGPTVSLRERIDVAIANAAGGPLAGPSSDAEFLRRASLDLAGTIPTAAAAREFLADKTPDKRTRLIDRLLAGSDFPRRMQQVLTVSLLERRAGKTITDRDWNAFVRDSFSKNKPWDRFVRELVSADGQEPANRAAIRFFVDGGRNDHHQMTRDVARLFLGMDLQCARCHDHPNIADYKQSDYFGLYAYLKQSRLQTGGKLPRPLFIETAGGGKIEFGSVFSPTTKHNIGPRLPGGKEIAVPEFAKGEELATPAVDGKPAVPKFRPRQLLATNLASADNRPFVRNSANRFWFLLMGHGLVHPLDLHHGKNPPSHPELLAALADDFAGHHFDVRYLLREISLSESYGRSSKLPEGLKGGDVKRTGYRVANAKPLSAEQLLWAILQATGNLRRWQSARVPESPEKAAGAEKTRFTYKDYINGRIPPPRNLPDTLTLFSATFGNPPGEAEVEFAPSMSHSLFLTNEKLILEWLEPHEGNLVARLAMLKDLKGVAEELYLAVLTRFPDAAERAEVAEYLGKNKARRSAAIADLAWALLSSTEFRLNH